MLRSDGITPCIAPTTGAVAVADRLARLLARAADSTGDGGQCVVYPFGRETSTASFAMYTFSIAVFLQAVVVVSFSALADYGMTQC